MTTADRIQRGLAALAQGQKLHAEKQYLEASRSYQRALSLMPDHPQVLVSAGALAEEAGDWGTAERVYRRLVTLRPRSGADGRLAAALFQLQRYAEAIPLIEEYFSYRPDEPDLLHALCNCLCMEGRWEDGLAAIRRALAIREEGKYYDAEMNALYQLGRIEEFDARIDGMLARYPESREIRSLYSLHRLKCGDYENGFRFFDDLRWRNTIGNSRSPRRRNVHETIPPWDGKPFDGVLIVTSEQGLGDEIMLSSMFADLIASGQRAYIECDERLLTPYQRAWPDIQFMARRREKKLSFPDGTELRSVTALDMAHVFRSTLADFPQQRRSWLTPDPARVAALRESYRRRWPGRRLVGLSWKSSRVLEGGGTKNINITDFVPLLSRDDTQFINLQYGDISGDLAAIRGAGVDLYVDPDIDTMDDIESFAAQIAALDLVVSSSNTTVHVAGAIGAPCWLLLPHTRPILWYWGYRGETTPWYPSLRLFRNTRNDEWTDLLRSVNDALSQLPVPGPGP